MAHRSDRRGGRPITRLAVRGRASDWLPARGFHDGPEPNRLPGRGRRYDCSPTVVQGSGYRTTATALRARQGPAAAFGGALRAALTRAHAAAWVQLRERRKPSLASQRKGFYSRRFFLLDGGVQIGLCASLPGLQRYANTDRVSNDGVSGVGESLDDLTAALANSSKTLHPGRLSIQTGGTPSLSPPAWQCRRRRTVGPPHFESTVDACRGCRPSEDLFVEFARRRDVRYHKRQPANATNTFRLVCGPRFLANDGDYAECGTHRVYENGP